MSKMVMVVVSLCVGCAAGDESEPAPETNYAPLPAGSGWECFRDAANDLTLCARPGRCAEMRANYEGESKRRGVFVSLSTCVARPAAACFSYRSTLGVDGALCCETMGECGAYRAGALAAPEDWRDVSPCTAMR